MPLVRGGVPAYSTAGRSPVSRKTPRSDTPTSGRDMPTEVVSFGGSPFASSSLGGAGGQPGAGPLGSGTLAFEPGFTLDSHYSGEAPQFAEGSQFGVYVVGPCIGEGGYVPGTPTTMLFFP